MSYDDEMDEDVQLGVPTDAERIESLITFEGKYQDLEKIAIETMCRTARDPIFCFELALQMQRLRKTISDARRERATKK